jgi:signal transduction histidine kinase
MQPLSSCSPATDRTAGVLAYAHRLFSSELPTTGPTTLSDLLEELATAYGSLGAGVVAPLDGPGIFKQESWLAEAGLRRQPCPWERDARLFDRAGVAVDAIVVSDQGDASWLLTGLAHPDCIDFLVWVVDRGERCWSAGERACLPLVGQAWIRLLRLGSPNWAAALKQARVRRALEQAVSVAGRLAHDFGNYLTGILGFTELALKELPEESLPRRYLTEVCEAAKDGAGWVHRLQNLRRGQPSRFEPTDLASVAHDEQERTRSSRGEAVALTMDLEGALPLVQVDSESLRLVLAHLLDNAREAIPDAGAITLAARTVQLKDVDCQELLGSARPGTFVEITIADTGVGLPPALRHRSVTDFFFSTKPRHRGLGLVTVFSIVQLHQGGVRFGPHPEQGTVVRVFLPVAPGPPLDVLTEGAFP